MKDDTDLLPRNGEHPLSSVHLEHLSEILQNLLKGLRRTKIQQDSTLREE